MPYLDQFDEATAEKVASYPWYDPAMTFRKTCGFASGLPTVKKDIVLGNSFYDLYGNITTPIITTTTTVTTTTTTVAPATVTMTISLDIDLASLSPTDLQSVKGELLEAVADAGGFDFAHVDTIELVQRAPTPAPTPAPAPGPPSTTQTIATNTTPTSTNATNTTPTRTTATNTTTTTSTTTTSTFVCAYGDFDPIPNYGQACEDHFGGPYSDLIKDYEYSCCQNGVYCFICLTCGYLDTQAVNDLHYKGEFTCRNGASAQGTTAPTNLDSTPGMINHPINATIIFKVYNTNSRNLVRVDLDLTIWTLQGGSETAIATAGFTVVVSFRGRYNIVAVVDEMTFFISETSPGPELDREDVDSAITEDDNVTSSSADAATVCITGDACINGFLFVGLAGGGGLLVCIICSCICCCLCRKKGENEQPLQTVINHASSSPHAPMKLPLPVLKTWRDARSAMQRRSSACATYQTTLQTRAFDGNHQSSLQINCFCVPASVYSSCSMFEVSSLLPVLTWLTFLSLLQIKF
jgi:hypothetical protein